MFKKKFDIPSKQNYIHIHRFALVFLIVTLHLFAILNIFYVFFLRNFIRIL